KRVLAIVICAFVTCGSAWAQTVAVAQISGTVKDPSGAVLPGVEIKVTQTETGVSRTTITAGPQGGPNWGGASFNPDLGYLFLNTSELGQMQGFKDRTAAPQRGRRGDDGSNPYEAVPGGGRFK